MIDLPDSFCHRRKSAALNSQSVQQPFDSNGTPGGSAEHLMLSVREFYTDLYEYVPECTGPFYQLALSLSADDNQNSFLESPISLAEITAALRGMKPTKASAIDGLPVEFYRRLWDIISDNLHAVLVRFKLWVVWEEANALVLFGCRLKKETGET